MDSTALLQDDFFDFTSNNVNGDFQIPFHPPSQLQQTRESQLPTLARVHSTDNSSNDMIHSVNIEGFRALANMRDGDLDNNLNIDRGCEHHPPLDNKSSGGGKRQKMMMHREVEKQRRQDMAFLHVSLRSLLPLEYLKGKRSMSDHLEEAVNYINHLSARNQVLRDKRDQLRTLQAINGSTYLPHPNPNPTTDNHRRQSEQNEYSPVSRGADRVVVVNACRGGVEVLVRVGQDERLLRLSLILKALAQEGLDVTNFISTNMGSNVWLHCLQAQALKEGINIDTSKLQHKLMGMGSGEIKLY